MVHKITANKTVPNAIFHVAFRIAIKYTNFIEFHGYFYSD